MCADWSIHDKGDGNPHVHLLVTMRPFNPDHSWGNKEVKDWDFVRDTDGNIVVDESHPDWWQDKKNPDRHGIRIPVLDENGVQKVGARNRKQWKRVLTEMCIRDRSSAPFYIRTLLQTDSDCEFQETFLPDVWL